MKYNKQDRFKSPLQRKIDNIMEQRKTAQPKTTLKDSDFVLDEWEDIEERGY